MTFNSLAFLLFFPIVALFYFILPKKPICKTGLLLLSGYVFYMYEAPVLGILLLGTTAVSYFAALRIEKSEKPSVRKLWLSATLVVCLGVLFFFKYFDFLSVSLCELFGFFGVIKSPVVLHLLLPVGISFYTFQTLSYVIDVYRFDIKAERNFGYYALFVSFFPQLVAGPIERPENLLPQLKEIHPFDKENAKRGASLMLLGFFKKVVVADGIAAVVEKVYGAPNDASGFSVLLATVLFAVQIYCDFSGYTDIATGCARILGVRLMKNFDHPYLATSVRDFWSRWHISLSSWLRDYLYIPLGGNRKGTARTLCNILLVFLASGLWHGAAWTFVLWGGIHGVYQIVGRLTAKPRSALLVRLGLSEDSAAVVWERRAVTFILVDFAWLFFRADSPSDAFVLIRKLFTAWQTPLSSSLGQMGISLPQALLLLCSFLLLWLLDRLVRYDEKDKSALLYQNGAFIYLLFVIFFAWAMLLSENRESTFIYFQF